MKADREVRKAAELEANPEQKESETEHEKVLEEQTAVKHVGGLRKRHRGLNLASERPQKPKERSQGNCGSRKNLTAASRTTILACKSGTAQGKRRLKKSD